MLGLLKTFAPNPKEYPTVQESERIKLYEEINQSLNNLTPVFTTQTERNLIREIYKETEQHNVNNLTRTEAYLRFFSKHKEIHWSFLAHMVSRNGGYSMTDLKSSLVSHFFDNEKRQIMFDFLERANALIFYDAYPQLLLYEKSKNENRSYFHLLPAFHISKFMIPIWNYFLSSSNSSLLTLALITNEQNYVEKHLMSSQTTKNKIFHTLPYVLQEKMGLTHVIFPYKRYPFLRYYKLSGIEVHEFSSVSERIQIGKQLYSILFSKHQYNSIYSFANYFGHSGSRSDYWPHLYTKDNHHVHKIYSPSLPHAWNDVLHSFPTKQDWFTDIAQIKSFEIGITMKETDITKDVKRDLNILLALGKLKLTKHKIG